ncbi:NUDIX domain-containing protein [Streptomyces sp. BI20]|uniref:NUDIX domain-containing protein n=1 Tax=Streptomyces sp. BI20 TaxID=3403460 RepID=UPI003C787E39
MHDLDAASHLAGRPKSLTAATLVCADAAGRVLLVRTAYGRRRRQLPGGGVDRDTGETPREAARREAWEELGPDLAPGRLLAVDRIRREPRPTRVGWVYEGPFVDAELTARIRLAPVELAAWRMAGPEEWEALVPARTAARLREVTRVLREGGGPVELCEGRRVEEGGAGADG